MAITTDDFNKIWASTSPLTPYSFSAPQYKEGWNFIGSTPPSRQMWDYLQKNNDEKMQYLLNHFDNYLPLSGGSITGDVDITGDLSVSGAIYSSSGGVLPGTVTAFSGTFKDGFPVNKNTGLVDKEWHLCDGTNGTPDLRNRFIYGGNGTNSGATGGEASHKLTKAELPKITGDAQFRVFNANNNIVGAKNDSASQSGVFSFVLNSGSKWALSVQAGPSATTNTDVLHLEFGENQPHNNMPPYYTLAYIMKL